MVGTMAGGIVGWGGGGGRFREMGGGGGGSSAAEWGEGGHGAGKGVPGVRVHPQLLVLGPAGRG